MPIVSTTKMTARQFLELGEDPPGVRLELVDGEVAVSPSAIPDHSYVVFALSHIVWAHIRKHDLGQLVGDVDTIFDQYNVRRPDIIYFSRQRLHLIGEKAIEGPPDLCVEVLSPSSIEIDRIDKFELYQAHGVVNYWIVDPAARSLEGWRLEHGQYKSAGRAERDETIKLPPFPDLPIPLAKLWRPK
jgi:Uma2 family endonuclease